jgi:hypothetical protein
MYAGCAAGRNSSSSPLAVNGIALLGSQRGHSVTNRKKGREAVIMISTRPITLAGFLCIGFALALAPAKKAMAQTDPTSPIGHSYELKFSDARWWTMDVQPTKLLFTAMGGEKKGQVVLAVDNPTLKEIGGGVFSSIGRNGISRQRSMCMTLQEDMPTSIRRSRMALF